jgi:hypothetical protein
LDEPHDGQLIDAERPNISFSNFVRHLLQRNSKIGIAKRFQLESYPGTSMADSGQLPVRPHGTLDAVRLVGDCRRGRRNR